MKEILTYYTCVRFTSVGDYQNQCYVYVLKYVD